MIIFNRMLILSAFLMVLLNITAAEADIYRYADEDGVICYTDSPMNKKAERVMKTETTSPREPQGKSKGIRGETDFHGIVADKASKYAIDPSLVHAVIKTESNGNPYAVSRKGAMGLMQLMPGTASDLEVRNPFDPEENIDGGTKYLRDLIERFKGDLTLALAAYNAGPKAVEKRGSVPEIAETKQYVRKVLSLYNGVPYHPLPSSGASAVSRTEQIYKIVTEDGSILFTNSPVYKKNPRF